MRRELEREAPGDPEAAQALLGAQIRAGEVTEHDARQLLASAVIQGAVKRRRLIPFGPFQGVTWPGSADDPDGHWSTMPRLDGFRILKKGASFPEPILLTWERSPLMPGERFHWRFRFHWQEAHHVLLVDRLNRFPGVAKGDVFMIDAVMLVIVCIDSPTGSSEVLHEVSTSAGVEVIDPVKPLFRALHPTDPRLQWHRAVDVARLPSTPVWAEDGAFLAPGAWPPLRQATLRTLYEED